MVVGRGLGPARRRPQRTHAAARPRHRQHLDLDGPRRPGACRLWPGGRPQLDRTARQGLPGGAGSVRGLACLGGRCGRSGPGPESAGQVLGQGRAVGARRLPTCLHPREHLSGLPALPVPGALWGRDRRDGGRLVVRAGPLLAGAAHDLGGRPGSLCRAVSRRGTAGCAATLPWDAADFGQRPGRLVLRHQPGAAYAHRGPGLGLFLDRLAVPAR